MKINGKVAIVTGASSGFGKMLSLRLISSGARVVLGDISVAAGQELLLQLNSRSPASAIFVKCDVTKAEDLKLLFDSARKAFGRIDIVVNNAGIVEKEEFTKDLKDSWKSVIDIDLTAVIMGTRMAISEMVKQPKIDDAVLWRGAIINTASLAGLYPQSQQPIYAAAKSGVVNFTRSLGYLFTEQGIHVNCICPSFSDTPILNTLLGKSVPSHMKVPISLVIDAFILGIEDQSLKGDVIRVTPEYGIDIVGRRRKSKL
ncbi:hypothetical protein BDV3_003694 [Batrachochytrium dendrobatidis]|uniref:Uncharacterized protein n=1 Tax=Batrachochytrium dendrobatidis (strain JEL423) TaxID=403673 RepID=A0A177WFH0_BATDL|nr:hypothetical protein O5D80_002262 [Batrachochytrium dendrobatidis]KAK5669595.1 hypothetical protein QVD99_003986 [Batrachochytrium dendrobatidis]OAJ38121.1 hypothetical protein, variant [Batrachochytrium dendrobatidis JEL423]